MTCIAARYIGNGVWHAAFIERELTFTKSNNRVVLPKGYDINMDVIFHSEN